MVESRLLTNDSNLIHSNVDDDYSAICVVPKKWNRGLYSRISFAAALFQSVAAWRIPQLPNELGEDFILACLNPFELMQIRCVSKLLLKWADAALSRIRDLVVVSKNIHAIDLSRLLLRFPSIRRFRIARSSVTGLTSSIGMHLDFKNCCKTLQCLEVFDCGKVDLSGMFESCESLCNVSADCLDDVALLALGKTCGRTLEFLDCNGSGQRVSGQGILKLAGFCETLHSLTISGCAVKDSDLVSVSRLSNISNRLSKLDVSYCGASASDNTTPDFLLTAQGLIRSLHNFRSIEFLRCRGVHPSEILLNGLSTLFGETDSESKYGKRKPLSALDIGETYRLKDSTTFRCMLRFCGSSFTRLTILDCRNIGDLDGFYDIPIHCPLLVRLELSGCAGVTDLVLDRLARHCPQLQKAVFRRCANVFDDGIRKLVIGARQLRWLDLGSCANLTNRSLESIARFCPLITHLYLFCCTSLSDFGFRSSLNRFPKAFSNLRVLEISWCFNISIECVKEVVSRATRMEKVHVEGLGQVTNIDELHLKLNRPHLNVVCGGWMSNRPPTASIDRLGCKSSGRSPRNRKPRSVSFSGINPRLVVSGYRSNARKNQAIDFDTRFPFQPDLIPFKRYSWDIDQMDEKKISGTFSKSGEYRFLSPAQRVLKRHASDSCADRTRIHEMSNVNANEVTRRQSTQTQLAASLFMSFDDAQWSTRSCRIFGESEKDLERIAAFSAVQ